MAKKSKSFRETVVAADPNQWSPQSKRSYAFHYRREYADLHYSCYRCRASCVFTAQDQKYTYEVKKASIDQRRQFCASCWSESHRLKASLGQHEVRWLAEKVTLQTDGEFLRSWLALLMRWKEFEPHRTDVARINMLERLLSSDRP